MVVYGTLDAVQTASFSSLSLLLSFFFLFLNKPQGERVDFWGHQPACVLLSLWGCFPATCQEKEENCRDRCRQQLGFAALTNLARNERSGMNGLALGEEVWVFASGCLGRIQKLQSRGLRHCVEADDNVTSLALGWLLA